MTTRERVHEVILNVVSWREITDEMTWEELGIDREDLYDSIIFPLEDSFAIDIDDNQVDVDLDTARDRSADAMTPAPQPGGPHGLITQGRRFNPSPRAPASPLTEKP